MFSPLLLFSQSLFVCLSSCSSNLPVVSFLSGWSPDVASLCTHSSFLLHHLCLIRQITVSNHYIVFLPLFFTPLLFNSSITSVKVRILTLVSLCSSLLCLLLIEARTSTFQVHFCSSQKPLNERNVSSDFNMHHFAWRKQCQATATAERVGTRLALPGDMKNN